MNARNEMDRPDVLAVVFHPRPDMSAPDPEREVVFRVDGGVVLGGRLETAGRHAPLILFFHGNGEIASDYADIAPVYARLGLSFLVVDYRGYGRSSGSPTVSNLLEDARRVWSELPAFLEERDLKPSALYAMGRSLGSASALEIALTAGDRLAGLIVESGFAFGAELVARLGGPRLVKEDDGRVGLGHLVKIEQIAAPTLIIHGEADWIIPVEDARALHAHSGAARKWLVTVPGAGHNDLLWVGRDTYFKAIADFVDLK